MRIINSGCTRLVILVGPFAFKIAKIRLGYPLQRAFTILKTRKFTEKTTEWRSERRSGLLSVIVQAVFAGVFANLAERRLWPQYPDADLVPTLWGCGLINIQMRGDALGNESIFGHPIMRLVRSSTTLGADTCSRKQYCVIKGRVLLADYGNPALGLALERAWVQ